MYKRLTAHSLAHKLLTFPDLPVWININNDEGGRVKWNISVEDSHACDIDLEEALGNERLYNDEVEPIYSPIIYLYDEYNKPDYSDLLWSEFVNYGYKHQTIQVPNNSFTNTDRIPKYAKYYKSEGDYSSYLIIDKVENRFKLSMLKIYRDLIGINVIGVFDTLEELKQLELM